MEFCCTGIPDRARKGREGGRGRARRGPSPRTGGAPAPARGPARGRARRARPPLATPPATKPQKLAGGPPHRNAGNCGIPALPGASPQSWPHSPRPHFARSPSRQFLDRKAAYFSRLSGRVTKAAQGKDKGRGPPIGLRPRPPSPAAPGVAPGPGRPEKPLGVAPRLPVRHIRVTGDSKSLASIAECSPLCRPSRTRGSISRRRHLLTRLEPPERGRIRP